MSVVTVPLTARMGSRPICASEAILLLPTQTLTLTVMGHLTSCSWTVRTNQWRILGDARDACLPGGPNSFIFMQFLAKKNRLAHSLWELAPPSGKSWIGHCKWVFQPSARARTCMLPTQVLKIQKISCSLVRS